MTCLLSQPAESLLEASPADPVDTVIVGSGYGAAMAALRLSEPDAGIDPRAILVLERGREYQPGDFPKTLAELPGYLFASGTGVTTGARDALFDVRMGDGASALVGSGLGGTSLINGGVAIDPSESALARWPERGDGRPWSEVMQASGITVKRLLGVTRADGSSNVHPDPESLGKFRALREVARGLRDGSSETGDIESVEGPRPIPLAISFSSGDNAVGVHQDACIDCGNCISGCNIGAKNTLAMNAWPLAQARGVRIYTGASVIDLARDGEYWVVNCTLTSRLGELDGEIQERRDPGVFSVRARRVILAAGTLGSSEILLRSKLSRSDRLGEGFSVNGDMMVLGLRRRQRVDSAARAPSTADDLGNGRPAAHPVGPLTMSEIRVRVRDRERSGSHEVSIQDGAVPYPMRHLFAQLLSTEHLARLFVDGRSPDGVDPAADLLATDPALLEHSQLMTVMGWEPNRGSLRLRALRSAPDLAPECMLQPHWDVEPESRAGSYFHQVETLFERAEAGGGFDGGLLLPCPPWRMIPDGLEALEGLGNLRRHLVTTHPLGGCCMASDAAHGVVDTRGRVFSGGSGTATHEGLYVMDGAIVPAPVGVNPFMTIAQLAYTLADDLVADQHRARTPPHDPAAESMAIATQERAGAWDAARARIPFGHGHALPDPADETVAGRLQERLFLDLGEHTGGAKRTVARLYAAFGLHPRERLVLEVSSRCDDLLAWLEMPSNAMPASYRFARTSARGDTVPDDAVIPLDGAAFEGSVTLGGLAPPPNRLVREWRRLRVLAHFVRMRGDELLVRAADFLRGRAPGSEGPGRFLSVTFKQARVQSTWRYMRYQFEGRLRPGEAASHIRFLAQKTLAYRGGQLDPLNALRVLPFTLNGRVPAPRRAARFRVDMIDFTRDLAPFQVYRTPNTPTTIMALLSAGLFFLRGIVQTHFWSFGAPSYRRYGDQPDMNRARLEAPPAALAYPAANSPDRAVREDQAAAPLPGMRLVRYRPSGQGNAPPVLLIHGLAHGSRVFWTETVEHNLAQHLLGQGFDVWLLDHRLSCNLNDRPDRNLSMEDIASVDIPWAVRTVYESVNRDRSGAEPVPVNVFAHCIGAGAFAIAALNGRLRADDGRATPMVGRVVIHAVTPWLVASEDNRWRANVVSMFRSYFDDLDYDPIPHADPTIAESMADRFSSSFGWSVREFRLHRSCRFEHGHHFSRTICNRMTLYYGDEWLHENLDPRTHAGLHTLVGPAPIEVLRQVYYCIVRGRLTNREGANEYVREDRIRDHWSFPTLFLHGDCNKVFNADGSRTTALKMRAILGAAGNDTEPSPISLRVVQNYGHMDLLFGRNAWQDVYPHIAEHLHGGQRAGSPRDAEPVADPRPPVAPVTGPIISAPVAHNGGVTLSVWTEASRYTAREPHVAYRSGGRELPLAPIEPAAGPGSAESAAAAAPRAPDPAPQPPGQQTEPALTATQLGRLDLSGIDAPVELVLHYRGAPESPPPVARFDWRQLPWFQRVVDGHHGSVSFLVGSCLYPGAPAEQELSDAVFAAMRPWVEGDPGAGSDTDRAGVDHLLLVGDQIYADATANLFDPAAPLERFRDRYRRAFGGPGRRLGGNAHWVMSHLPTYFAVDDHEVSENWPQDLLRRRHPQGERYGPEQELRFARAEARRFMMHHTGDEDRLYYDFRSAGQSFFVFDTRTERQPGRRADVATVIGPQQRDAFRQWLAAEAKRGARRAVIVSGSPLGPIRKVQCRHPELAGRADSLLGHPGFLVWLHGELHQQGMEELIWISGDVHLSCRCDYRIRVDGRPLKVRHIVASGLFAPLPFANPAWEEMAQQVDYQRTVAVAGLPRCLQIDGEQKLLSRSRAHFVRVRLDSDDIQVEAFEAEGIAAADTADTAVNGAA